MVGGNVTLAQTLVIVPGAGLQSALDGDLLALAEVSAAYLREAVPRDHVVEFGPFLAVAGVLGRGDAELGDVLAARQRAHLGIARQAPGPEDLVHGPCSFSGRPTGHGPTLRAAEARL